jgi:preprotein translocase subunit YajC
MRIQDMKRLKPGQNVRITPGGADGKIISIDGKSNLAKIKLNNESDYAKFYNGHIARERGYIEIGRYNFAKI